MIVRFTVILTNTAVRAAAMIVLWTAVCLGVVGDATAQPSEFNYDESKVPDYTLPDPLLMADGKKVTDAETWRTKRRGELLSLFKQHVYGSMPPPMAIAHADLYEFDTDALAAKGRERR